jgi:hypothetical protein
MASTSTGAEPVYAAPAPAPAVSEADPILRQPPVLEDLIDESLFSSPASSTSSQSLLSTDDESTPLLPRRRDRHLPWYRRPSPRL